jgi:hypothetical protein
MTEALLAVAVVIAFAVGLTVAVLERRRAREIEHDPDRVARWRRR